MEEARQHSAVTGEKWVVAAIYFGALLALLVGIALQLTIGGQSMAAAALIFVISKVVTVGWTIVRPNLFEPVRPTWRSWLVLLVWCLFAVGLISVWTGK